MKQFRLQKSPPLPGCPADSLRQRVKSNAGVPSSAAIPQADAVSHHASLAAIASKATKHSREMHSSKRPINQDVYDRSTASTRSSSPRPCAIRGSEANNRDKICNFSIKVFGFLCCFNLSLGSYSPRSECKIFSYLQEKIEVCQPIIQKKNPPQ
jgi:hypothetical protein